MNQQQSPEQLKISLIQASEQDGQEDSPDKKQERKKDLHVQIIKGDREDGIDDRWYELKIAGKYLDARSYHTVNTYKESVVTYGGYDINKGILDDFYKMKISDMEKYEWKQIIPTDNSQNPGPRRRHTAVVYEDLLYLFGGQTSTAINTNQLNLFDFIKSKWILQKTVNPPPPIDSHIAILYEPNQSKAILDQNPEQNKSSQAIQIKQSASNDVQMVIFGGFFGNEEATYSNGVYSLNIQNFQWECLCKNDPLNKQFPAPRSGSGGVIYFDKLFIFGGNQMNIKFGDMWGFDLKKRVWEPLQVKGLEYPDPRNGHSTILYKNYMFIFGGIQDITKEKNDVFAFNLNDYTWTKVHTNTNAVYSKSPGKRKTNQKEGFKISPQRHADSSPSRKKYDMLRKHSSSNNSGKQQLLHYEGGLSPETKSKDMNSMSFNSQTNYLSENKKKQIAQQKEKMLKELDVLDPQEKLKLRASSPTTETMRNSIQRIGDQSPKKRPAESNLNTTQKLVQSILLNPSFKAGSSMLMGKKPCARDGQASCLVTNKMLIFGGDRHLMSFNDIYYFDLDLALKKHVLQYN